MQRFIILLFSILFATYSNAQDQSDSDKTNHSQRFGSIQLNAGTLHVYRTLSIGYESPTLLQLGDKHQFRLAVNGGLWHARLYNSTVGTQFNSNVTYLFGGKPHKLEIGVGITSHFAKGLKGQTLAYIASLPNTFLGYRYEKSNGRLFFKGGLGWYEAVQVGLGFRF
ncbi:MAG: hypothetical protein GQ574_15975 [Crocinitomix sp.]|nr:hypothetical protein [Crocinitomix sp.]